MKDYYKEANNIHLSYYLEAADALDISYEVILKGLMARFEYKNKHWFILNTVTPLVNSPGKTIAARKNLGHLVLSKANIPTPTQKTLSTVDEGLEFYNKFKTVVLKPKQNIGGRGVSVLPGSKEDIKRAFDYARKNDHSGGKQSVLIEEYVSGENFRLLTLGEEVIGVVKRLKPQIVGDGHNTIKNLILTTSPKTPIDYETTKVLNSQNLNLESIPKAKQVITTRNNTNLTAGGKTEEFSRHIHPYYKDIATKAIKAIGIKLGGVDIIAEDITKPGKCVVNEINYNPGLRIHYQVHKGEKIKVAIPIMKYIRDNEL